MSILISTQLRIYLTLLSVVLISFVADSAFGDIMVSISDTTGGVEFAWSGSIDTSGLSSSGPFNNIGGIQTSPPLVFSSTTPLGGIGETFTGVVSGPVIGTSSFANYANTLTGDYFAMNLGPGAFVMPTGYVSDTDINGSVEFTGPSLASLGITPGPFAPFTITNSSSEILINIVPEPAGAFMVAGLFGICAFKRRRIAG